MRYPNAARTRAITASWNTFFRNFRFHYQGWELGYLPSAEPKFAAGRVVRFFPGIASYRGAVATRHLRATLVLTNE